MYNFLKKNRWKKHAKLKLSDPDRRSSEEYIKVLKNQSKGRCLSCGIGKIKSFVVDKNLITIKFSCGHGHKEVHIKEAIQIRESNKILLVPKGKGKRNFLVRYIQGWFKSSDPKLNDGVFKEQLIDRCGNKYKEKIVNASNKKDVIKNKEHPLSEHQGYGSAKFKK